LVPATQDAATLHETWVGWGEGIVLKEPTLVLQPRHPLAGLAEGEAEAGARRRRDRRLTGARFRTLPDGKKKIEKALGKVLFRLGRYSPFAVG
jgi:hypothetical protein